MGLGLNGGGSASARFFAEAGAEVTVTDLRSEEVLKPSIEALADLNLRYVLGRHDIADFRNADVVIKNPAVKPGSPYIEAALSAGAAVETDISVFLQQNLRPVIAVTGSKGKSTTVSAVHYVLKQVYPDADLGGNITVSPLTFCSDEKNSSGSPVVLELSSWQLADLAGRNLLKPAAAAITNIMHDHQDRYGSMQDYAEDKAVIYEAQPAGSILLLNADSEYTESFALSAPSRVVMIFPKKDFETISTGADVASGVYFDKAGRGFWLEKGEAVKILDTESLLKGMHNRINLLTAAALLYSIGLDPAVIRKGLTSFPGIAHRLEFIRNAEGLDWYNDSAATIPEAAAAAVESFSCPLHLITGGTDKDLDFSPLADAVSGRVTAPESVTLLQGTGTDKIVDLFEKRNIKYYGPFGSLNEAVDNVLKIAAGKKSGQAAAVLSPGCSSFGMFKNEFDRGDQFRELVRSL